MTNELTDQELIEKFDEAYRDWYNMPIFKELLTRFKQRTAANPLTVESVVEAVMKAITYPSDTLREDIAKELRTALQPLFNAKLATPQKDNWISVDERLPERGQNILFIMKSRDKNYNGRVLGGRFNGYDFSTPGFGCDASHWKPIDLTDLPDLSPSKPDTK